jgi:CRISP-associated protein Cas1
MLKRTLFFSNPFRLNLKQSQMVITPKSGNKSVTIPIEDIGFVVIENMQSDVSLPLLEALVKNNVAVVFCNSLHHPQSLLLNLDSNTTQSELFRHQIDASIPLKKNLWKQTVEAKLYNQARCLKVLGKQHSSVMLYAKRVRSGDPDNREGAAARAYWLRLFGEEFNRDRFGATPNDLLNYGYTILRAAVARALSGSGLLPTLGIHHRNKYNAYCLADDIMEPYRPLVDRRVFSLFSTTQRKNGLTNTAKAELLRVLSDDVILMGVRRPLLLALSQTTASLARCFAGQEKKIKFGMIP